MARRSDDQKPANPESHQLRPDKRQQKGGFLPRGCTTTQRGYPEVGQNEQNTTAGLETRNSANEWFSAPLAAACDHLGIDDCALAETVFQRVCAGESEPTAVRMTLVEYLQRRGKYHGILQRLVDSGLVFQVQADDCQPDQNGE